MTLFRTALAGIASMTLALSASADSVYDTLASKERFSTLVAAIDAAGLQDALGAEDASLTVFAPNNDAFSAIDPDDLTALLGDVPALTGLLTYHVVGDEIRFREFTDGPLATLNGAELDIDVRDFFWWRQVKVDDNRILRANIHADNGVIHEIGSVLDPSNMPTPSILEIAAADPDNFSTLTELVELAGLDRILSSEYYQFTVFAPTNAAFEALPDELVADLLADRRLLREVLLFHLVRGSVLSTDLSTGPVQTLARKPVDVTVSEDGDGNLAVMVQDADVVIPDVIASNGVIHVLNAVLLPELPKSITDLANEVEQLSTLATALDVAGLADTFDSTHPYPKYTVFAPRNAAFDALPEGALEDLLADPEALADVLSLHVVRGQFTANRLRDGQRLHALNGERLPVEVDDEGNVSIAGANVVAADNLAANGVVHIIDAVLMEEPYTLADFVAEKRYLSTLNAALGATGLDAALGGEGPLTVFAPTNRAFDKLPDGTVEALLADTDALSNILLYHVTGGAQTLADLGEAGSATTLQGSDVEVSSQTVRIWWWRFTIFRVNDSVLLATDLQTDNGIAHIIDSVLIPPAGEGDGE